jgi:hypothetical protein
MVDVTASISAPATAANTAPFTVTGGGGGAVSSGAATATATNPAKWVLIAIVAGVAVLGLALIITWGRRR